jgi:hypothetical protein
MKKIKTIDVPQANTLEFAGELLALTFGGIKGNKELSKAIGIAEREIDYYKHAARILGFATFNNKNIAITEKGSNYLKALTPDDKKILLSKAVKESLVIGELLNTCSYSELNKSRIEEFLTKTTDLTRTTVGRRADTIIAWLRSISPSEYGDINLISKNSIKITEKEYTEYSKAEKQYQRTVLRSKIVAQPEVLGEKLNLIGEEYQLLTDDKLDILFLDKKSQFVAVCVDLNIGAKELIGLTRIAKCKIQLAIQYGLNFDNIRAVLAAYTIHPAVKERAIKYEIITKEVQL